MLGRGIDQILPCPSDPILYEDYVKSAMDYVHLAERAHGPIPRPSPYDYVWGDLLDHLGEVQPDARIINLETSVTTSDTPAPKGINYRMHPANIGCLTAAGVDCCVLANNHVLDWGVTGLVETFEALERAGIRTAGGGRNDIEASRPAVLDRPDERRFLVHGVGSTSSGIPPKWQAGERRPGVNLLRDLSGATADRLSQEILSERRPGDIVVVSIHWGANWGYDVPPEQRAFAHALIDAGACDVLHGHSSHHPRPIEVYRDRLILYGCGDFLNDYEGISGYEQYRGDLTLMYLPRLAADGRLLELTLAPFRIRRFRLQRAVREDVEWMGSTLDRECRPLGCRITPDAGHQLTVRWGSSA